MQPPDCRGRAQVLPAWLGVGHALQALFKQGHLAELQAMYEEWPFFTSTFDLIEMARPTPSLASVPALADPVGILWSCRKHRSVVGDQSPNTPCAEPAVCLGRCWPRRTCALRSCMMLPW